jgi:transposase
VPRTNPTYPPEFRREAIRLVRASDEEHPIPGIAREIGVSDGTLRNWVNQDAIDSGQREGLTTEEKEKAAHESSRQTKRAGTSPLMMRVNTVAKRSSSPGRGSPRSPSSRVSPSPRRCTCRWPAPRPPRLPLAPPRPRRRSPACRPFAPRLSRRRHRVSRAPCS